jgi:hypothetical protein
MPRPRLVTVPREAEAQTEEVVRSYDGACQLLGHLIRTEPELYSLVLERFGGRPTVAAFGLVAAALRRLHQEAGSEDGRAARLVAQGLKECSRCGDPLPLASFGTDRGRPRPECRECRNRARRERRSAHERTE